MCQGHIAWENPILIWGHKLKDIGMVFENLYLNTLRDKGFFSSAYILQIGDVIKLSSCSFYYVLSSLRSCPLPLSL